MQFFQAFRTFDNFQKEALGGKNRSGSTVSLALNPTSARGIKGSWGVGQGRTDLVVSGCEPSFSCMDRVPLILAVQFWWTGQSLFLLAISGLLLYLFLFIHLAGLLLSRPHTAFLQPFPHFSNPFDHFSQPSGETFFNFIMLVFTNKGKHLFLKSPFH